MFETYFEAEVPQPELQESIDGYRSWQFVLHRSNTYYFHVLCEPSEIRDSHLNRILFLPTVSNLVDLNINPNCRIVQVDIVMPPHMNGSEHWRMEGLRRIDAGSDEILGIPHLGYVFETIDGQRILHTNCRDESELQDMKTIFSL